MSKILLFTLLVLCLGPYTEASSIAEKIKIVGTVYGGIDDFFHNNTSFNDNLRRDYAEKIWKCIPYVGALPEHKGFAGISIKGAGCPVEYVRGFNSDTNLGFAEYTASGNDFLNLYKINTWQSDFHFAKETGQNAENLNYKIFNTYNFFNGELLNLGIEHKLTLSTDNSRAHRKTTYTFTDTRLTLVLTYEVLSSETELVKTCSAGGKTISCDDLYKIYGAVDLIPSW